MDESPAEATERLEAEQRYERDRNAKYTVSVVYRDGNPRDVSEHGPDLRGALQSRLEHETGTSPYHEHWMVYDADDPERGYFDEVDDAA